MLSKLSGILIAVSFFIILEIIIHIVPTYYMEEPEPFFVNYKRETLESGKGTADVIILGDSRSMTLEGVSKGEGHESSVYNHSLPGMGPRYYRYFLQKYLEYGNQKPKLLLFAGSQPLYSEGYGFPLYDPSGGKAQHNETISQYANRRWNEGLKNWFFSVEEEKKNLNTDDTFLWDFFGQRYLHQFSFLELYGQFEGIESIFILSKAAPLIYKTFKYRRAVRNAMTASNWKSAGGEADWVKMCSSCEAIESGLCAPSSSQLEDNLRIKEWLDTYHGKYNISNRMNPIMMFQGKEYVKAKTQETGSLAKDFKPNFAPLIDLIEFCEQNGIKFGFLYMPGISEIENRPLAQKVRTELLTLLKTRPTVGFFDFPEYKYSKDYFVDLIHLDCRGETKLNHEFKNIVLPQVDRFLKEEVRK
ncbi:DUF1574 domain-containing protein [Leptospira koniambonensis]|uniref:DUF1574 domain-containing protein n=1 Tax=Leptospira koniambonensis TaxID=2484950 RepID=A0A4R9J5N6_9LEPT|nr:DUF1574 domain-containing protein [Leptospira koniambonensis]TGL34006.1 DUF1574 domain-containing protein [Leptospira koniambonensis]